MVGLLIAALKGLVRVPQVTYMQALLAFFFCPQTLLQGNVVAEPAVYSDPFSTVNALCEMLRNLAQCSPLKEDPVVKALCPFLEKLSADIWEADSIARHP